MNTIESHFAEYCGRECVVMPSGRLAIYIALKFALPTNSRVLMSPINDDVVFFTVLAAGMQPVIGPVSDKTGNIDVDRISAPTWSTVDAVMTTNLHGIADDVHALRNKCKKNEVLLLEDAAHAYGVRVGPNPVGSFGQFSAFSFSKHLGIKGGALCVEDPNLLPEIRKLLADVLVRRSNRMKVKDYCRPMLTKTLGALQLLSSAKYLRSYFAKPKKRVREKWRMPVRPDELLKAIRCGLIDSFDPWIMVDGPNYRTELPYNSESTFRVAIEDYESSLERRMDGIHDLLRLQLSPEILGERYDQPLLRVPLLVDNRDELSLKLRSLGLRTEYIYDPPLGIYAGPPFASTPYPSKSATWWSSKVLPVNPMDHHQFVRYVRDGEIDLGSRCSK